MSNDSSLLPATSAPPGTATLYTAERTTVVPNAGGSVTSTDIEFDYSAHLNRIVTALEQMSLSMAFIADKIDNISTNSSTMAELATGEGIHMLGPYEWVGLISSYQLLVNQGEILNTESDVSPEKIAEAKAALIAFIEKIKELPTLFTP